MLPGSPVRKSLLEIIIIIFIMTLPSLVHCAYIYVFVTCIWVCQSPFYTRAQGRRCRWQGRRRCCRVTLPEDQDHDDHCNNMSTMMTKIMMMIMVKVTCPPSTVATGNGAESEALPPEEKITLMLRHYHHFHRHDHNSSSFTLHGNIYPKEMGVCVCLSY